MPDLNRLYQPVPARVDPDYQGRPTLIDGVAVDSIREDWLIEDRWWTDEPVRRRYWDAVTTGGTSVTVFHDLISGRWFRQRG